MFLICLVYYKTCSETKSLKGKWLGLSYFVPSGIKLLGSKLWCCLPRSTHHIKSFFPLLRYVRCLNVDRVDVSLRFTCPSYNSKKDFQKDNVSDGGSRGSRNSRAADFHCREAPSICRKTKGCSSYIFGTTQQFLAFSDWLTSVKFLLRIRLSQ